MAKIEVGLACGRNYLSVNGFVVAMEGDMCRDAELPGTHWNRELLESVVKGERKPYVKGDMFSSLTATDAEVQYRAQKLKDREEQDAWIASNLKETFAAVEASHNEQHTLWEKWSIENTYRVRDPRDQRPFIHWEHMSRGFMETVGAYRIDNDTMPVVLSIFWARLRARPTDKGRLVMFWEMCSQVTDSRMAERFFKENLPKKVITTDAQNFHNVVHALKE